MNLNPTGSITLAVPEVALTWGVAHPSTAALPFARCFVRGTRSQRHPSLAPNAEVASFCNLCFFINSIGNNIQSFVVNTKMGEYFERK